MVKQIILNRHLSINQFRINHFIFIIKLNFLFFTNLFADFYEFFKCCLQSKISINSKRSLENVCEQCEIAETNYWIILLVFDDKS